MKQLALLTLAILILGCGTETPVVEEPEPVIEEPSPVTEEPPPVKPTHHPLIAFGDVKHGQVNVDPKPLNHDGFRFQFSKPFVNFWATIYVNDSVPLYWEASLAGDSARRDSVWIRPVGNHDPLEYDTEYKLIMSFQDSNCDYTDIVIQFRTKPQRPVVGAPVPVIQERIPVAPLGERFRHDIAAPAIVAGDVSSGDANVDPEPLNANGIQFEWNTPIRKYKIDLRIHGGAFLGWLPRGLVEPDNPVRHTKIMPAEGFPLLEFDTTYQIDIFVQDSGCHTWEFEMLFHTKPKP